MTSKELRDGARVLWNLGMALHAQSYQHEADAYLLEGDPLQAEFYSALAACYRNEDGAQERKDKAYAALQAMWAEKERAA